MIIIIPGWLIALATFPGVIVHEIAHRLFCDLTGVAVYHIEYFRLQFFNFSDVRAGCVWDEGTNRLSHNLLISLAPLFINTLIACFCLLPLMAKARLFHDYIWCESPLVEICYVILAWVGLSAGANAFPSDQDMAIISRHAEYHENVIVSFLLSLLVSLVWGLNLLSRAWFSFLYALGTSWLFARAVIG